MLTSWYFPMIVIIEGYWVVSVDRGQVRRVAWFDANRHGVESARRLAEDKAAQEGHLSGGRYWVRECRGNNHV